MKTISLDFETYYDSDYSLRKMTPVEYILDPRFEVIGCAVAESNETVTWFEGSSVRDYLKGLPPEVAVVSHNALFDMCILAWRFGCVPKLMIDTLGMSRAMLSHKVKSHALSALSAYLGTGVKGGAVHKVLGMNATAIERAGLMKEYAEYCMEDARQCLANFYKLMVMGFPPAELVVMDMVLRCAVLPKFQLDPNALHEHLAATQAGKQALLDRVGMVDRDALMSNDRFAAALESLGVDPPRKTSLTTGRETWAFSKTDLPFLDLEEHENPDVQALVAARLGVKSTLEETRTQRLISISQLQWPSKQQRWMPIPLRYSGAHTHRLSGDWKINMQNLPGRKNNKIRTSLVAPPGRVVVSVDASQIEARINGWFCKQHDLTELWRTGADVYSTFAGKVYGYEVNKKDHPTERFLGKTCILGLGYGMGPPKFQKTVRIQSDSKMTLDDVEAARVVGIYRQTYSQITAAWTKLGLIIASMTHADCYHEWGPVVFQFESVLLPNGMRLYYHDLRREGNEWCFTYMGKRKRLYGAKLLENIVQALARIATFEAAARVRKRLDRLGVKGLDLAGQVHDELIYVPPVDLAKIVSTTVLEEMAVSPAWGHDLPLTSEAKHGPSYGELKPV